MDGHVVAVVWIVLGLIADRHMANTFGRQNWRYGWRHFLSAYALAPFWALLLVWACCRGAYEGVREYIEETRDGV